MGVRGPFLIGVGAALCVLVKARHNNQGGARQQSGAELLCVSKAATTKTARGRSPRRRRSLESSKQQDQQVVPAPRPSRSPEIPAKTRQQSRAEAALAAAASTAAALALELKQERAARALLRTSCQPRGTIVTTASSSNTQDWQQQETSKLNN